MIYFFNQECENNNFIAINKSLVLAATCLKEQFSLLERQLARGAALNEIFSIEDNLFIPFDKMISMSDEIDSNDLEIRFFNPDQHDKIKLEFEKNKQKIQFIKQLQTSGLSFV